MAALLKESELQKNYFTSSPNPSPSVMEKRAIVPEIVETIYFGGGTPSLLSISDLKLLLEKLKATFNISDNAEITLEANPDDIDEEKLIGWKKIGINRLSIGIQSFFD